MTTRSTFKVLGVTLGFTLLVVVFQNCSNKKSINLEEAIKYADQHSTGVQAVDSKDPILLTFTNSNGGNPVDTFTNGQTLYANVSSAGPNGLVCQESDATRTCLANFPSGSWKSLYVDGWIENKSQNKWSKEYAAGTTALPAGKHRFYFVRPKVDDPTKPNNYGSVEIQIQ